MASKVPSDPNLTAEMRRFLDTQARDADSLSSDLADVQAALPSLASQAEAEAGTDNVKYLSALRVAQAIDAQTLVPVFTKSYVSTAQTITSAGSLTLAHGLGMVPKLVVVTLINTTAEQGYSINDPTFPTRYGSSIVPDATNLNIRYESAAAAFSVIHKTTGSVATATNANWSAIFSAYA